MFKRIRWMGLGAVAGAGASVGAQVRLRRSLDEHPAIEVGARAARSLRDFGGDLRGAVVEGREAMAAREAALRQEVGARLGTSPRPGERRLRLVETDQADAVAPGEDADRESTGTLPPDEGPEPGRRSGRSGTHPAGRARRRGLRSS